MKTLYLIDASIYIFRAYFSLPHKLTGIDGQPVNAIYGFAEFLWQLQQASKGTHFVLAYDESLTSSFRNEIYPAYKSSREYPPPELEAQLNACRELADILGFKTVASERFEADDLIGTAARQLRPQGFRMVFVTADKDLAQLLRPGDRWWDFARKQKLSPQAVRTRLGVAPHQVVDLLALMGDAVDDIPGVPGVGLKTATTLLRELKSLDAIYRDLDRVVRLPIRGAAGIAQQLQRYEAQARLSRVLATIHENAPIRCTEASVRKQAVKPRRLQSFCHRHQFSDRMRQRLLAV